MCVCVAAGVLPTTLPSSDAARGVPRSTGCWLPVRTRRSLADLATYSLAGVWSHRSRAAHSEARHPHPVRQLRPPVRSACAEADVQQVPTSGASGPFGPPGEMCLWKFLGRARASCRSTVRASIWTRVIYKFYSLYERAPETGLPLVAMPSHSSTLILGNLF